MGGYVVLVHVLALLFVWYRQDAVLSTYIMIGLSFIFWSLMVQERLRMNVWGYALLTLTILVQPLETYYYFSLKAPAAPSSFGYDFSFNSMEMKNTDLTTFEDHHLGIGPLYYASGGYNFLYENINKHDLFKYLTHKIYLVDQLEAVDRQQLDLSELDHNFTTGANTAIVFKNNDRVLKLTGNNPNPSAQAEPVDEGTGGFKLLGFDANHLRMAMDVPYEKFLIYNDSYDPYWHVKVNNHQEVIYEVNGAFKGVWIPAGKSVIEFHYGCWWQFVINILLSLAAFAFLIAVIWCRCLSYV